ncbi:hypothetical protein HN51_067289 [Arachis hypogaea]
MIVVARGDRSGEDGIPMLLSIIGFGDIILPGLLVAFSLRYDWLAKRNLRSGYFVWAMSAYGLGLLITYVALNLMDGHGQPALLYIVPFTLGTLLSLGKKRGNIVFFCNYLLQVCLYEGVAKNDVFVKQMAIRQETLQSTLNEGARRGCVGRNDEEVGGRIVPEDMLRMSSHDVSSLDGASGDLFNSAIGVNYSYHVQCPAWQDA